MTTHCTTTRPTGEPCQARPLPGRDVCFFHDPAHADTLATARSKGGAAPRRVRRVPRLMDHLNVAEFMGEILIEALNHPDELDTKRLQALTRACALLLKAVGVPKGVHVAHPDRHEPSPDADHLLRVYAPLCSEVQALLAAETSKDSASPLVTEPPSPFPSSAELKVSFDTRIPPPSYQNRPFEGQIPSAQVDALTAAGQGKHQAAEQVADRTRTGLPGIHFSNRVSVPPSYHSLNPSRSHSLTPHPLIPLSSRLLERERLRLQTRPARSVSSSPQLRPSQERARGKPEQHLPQSPLSSQGKRGTAA